MPELTFDLDGLAETQQALDEMPELLGRAVDDAITIGAAEMEDAVVGRTPVGATGLLAGSILGDTQGTGLGTVGRVFSQDEPAKVMAVETGRRPGRMPPIAPIRLWATRVLGDPSAAWPIARAIGRRGTPGAHMFQRAWDASAADVRDRIVDRILRSLGGR